MNKKTHIWFGILVGSWLALNGFHLGYAFLGSVTGQVLPDVDTVKGHRKYLHTLIIPLILMSVGDLLLLAVGASWFVHIILDGMTKGVMYPLWPLKLKHSGLIKNGSLWEKSFALVMTGVFIVAGVIFLHW